MGKAGTILSVKPPGQRPQWLRVDRLLEEELPGRRQVNKVKVSLARLLLRETTMSLKWIARRPHMGSWTCVSNLLHEKQRH